MSSFFGRVLGKKAAATEEVKTTGPLAGFTTEQLIDELRGRGLDVEVKDKAVTDVAASTQVKVFAVLDSIEAWSKLDRHRNDKDRKFNQMWLTIYAFDWARTPLGYCCDANKSVKIGLSEYSKWEDANSSQIVVIQHYDSERPGNYEKRDSWGNVPPVWAVAFSTEEMRELTKEIVATAATKGTLIHREPEGDYDPNEPWWSESHWLIEDGKITGVRLAAKCTQDSFPQVQLVRFKLRGSTFELGTIEDQTSKLGALSTSPKPLPEPVPAIIPAFTNTNSAATTLAETFTEGNGKLEIRVSSGSPSAHNFDGRDDTLGQSIKTPTLTVTNPTDTRIAVTEYWMEFLQEDGTWYKASTRVGVNSTDYYGRSQTRFADCQSFEVDSHASLDLVLEGNWMIPKQGRCAYGSRPHCNRIHAAFPDPLTARVALKDNAGLFNYIQFQHKNEPLDELWVSYEDSVAAGNPPSEGFGPDFQPEMWLCVENPLNLNKCVICVTTAIENPHDWFIRIHSDRRNIGSLNTQVNASHFRKLGFKASLNADKPAEVEVDLGDATYCKLTGLVDYDTKTIYALHGVIHVENEGNTLAKVEGYMKLDYDRVIEVSD